MSKITYGFKRLTIFPKTNKGLEYGEGVEWKGAKSITLSKESTSNSVYADDVEYHTLFNSAEMKGTLEVLNIPDNILEILGGQTKKENGVYVSTVQDEVKPFALAFEFSNNIKATRYMFFNCKATLKEIAGETKEKELKEKVRNLDITITPLEVDDMEVIGARTSDSTSVEVYNNWYSSPKVALGKNG